MTAAYKPGQLTALLNGDLTVNKNLKRPLPRAPTTDKTPTKKRKTNSNNQSSKQEKPTTPTVPRKSKKTKRKRKKKPRPISKLDRETSNARTVFLGNIPCVWQSKQIKSFLSQWQSHIVSIHFSNYISKLRQKNLEFRRNPQVVNTDKTNKNAWVEMSNEKYVKQALSLNNTVIKVMIGGINNQFTIRVDYCNDKLQRNSELTLFIGNLPIDATEDMIRQHFESCGLDNIVNVRVIRDKLTQISKKCGFIQFKTRDSYSLALDMNQSLFLDPKKTKPTKQESNSNKKYIRVMPWIADAQNLKTDFDHQRKHLQNSLTKTKTKTKSKSKHNNAANDHDLAEAPKPKKRWRDHPNMRLECELRKKQLSVQRTLKRNLKSLNANVNVTEPAALDADLDLTSEQNKTEKLEQLKLELKKQNMIQQQIEHRKQVKQKKWRIKQWKIKRIIGNKRLRKERRQTKKKKAKAKFNKHQIRKINTSNGIEGNSKAKKEVLSQMGYDPKMFDDPAYN